jgi:four helix bundle protein
VATIKRFEDIGAWQEGRKLVRAIYQASCAGNFARDFALRDQIRRAAISIPSNIAEGFERDGNREFYQFLSLAKGSCGEVRTQLYLALDEAYVTKSQFDSLSEAALRISRMVASLMTYLRRSGMRGPKFKNEP